MGGFQLRQKSQQWPTPNQRRVQCHSDYPLHVYRHNVRHDCIIEGVDEHARQRAQDEEEPL